MSTALDKSPEYHSRSSSPLLDDQQDILTIFCCKNDDDKQFSSVNVDGHEVVPDDSESSKMPDQVTQAEDVRSLGQQNLVAVKADPRVIGKIEAIFEHVSQSLESGQDHVNLVLSPLSSRNDSFEHTDIDEDQPCKVISFPGKDGEEAWRFAVVMELMELMHEALAAGVMITKRYAEFNDDAAGDEVDQYFSDMYYRDPALFGNQAVVDRYVDMIAVHLRVSRSVLHVRAAAKGLMSGPITMMTSQGIPLDASTDSVLITDPDALSSIETSRVESILVIEKEASFQSITSSEAWRTIQKRALAITGKGYPDLLTRSMLRFVTTPSARNGYASPTVFALMDWDPDGIAILSVYKHGSANKAMGDEDLLIPCMYRLGLSKADLDVVIADGKDYGLLEMTGRDRSKARQLLGKPLYDERGVEQSWRLELQVMLMLNLKAELQILDENPDRLHQIMGRLSV